MQTITPMMLARPWVKPGTPGLEHRIGGIERDYTTGNISYDPANHQRMTEVRANKIAGIRGALCHDELSAEISRRHNDSNVLCLPADLLGDDLLRRMVQVWLSTAFAGGRHARRIKKVMAAERHLDPASRETPTPSPCHKATAKRNAK